jgi:hypothetical protein
VSHWLLGASASAQAPAHEPAPTALAFEEVTERVGLTYVGKSWSIAWGDGNGDGWPDLWATNHGDARLYWNRGDGTFRGDEELELPKGDIHGAAWADFDRDGDQDLLELSGAQRGHGVGENHFYVNSDGRLRNEAARFGFERSTLRGRAPFWLDYDRDGELDVLLACARRDDTASQLYLQREGALVHAPDLLLGREQAMFAQCARLGIGHEPWLLLHGFTYPQLVLDLSVQPPRDITQSCGLPRTLAVEDAALADFDGDGTTDIFLARGQQSSEILTLAEDHVRAHVILLDDVRGVSIECAGRLSIGALPDHPAWWSAGLIFVGESGSHPPGMPFDVDASAARGEWSPARCAGLEKGVFVLANPETGRWSIYVHGPRYEEITLEIRALEAPLGRVQPLGFPSEVHPPRDALLVRRGSTFVDIARDAGILPTNSQGAVAADFDNDGDVDLFVVTGTTLTNPPDLLYENLGEGRFRSLPDAAGAAGTARGLGDTASVADVDGDGFLDLLVSNGRGLGPHALGPLQLFRNRGNTNHWLRVRLVGRANLEQVGALVRLEAGGVHQTRTLGSQTHRGAQDESTLHFGLGASTQAARLEVLWPDGSVTALEQVAADQVLVLEQGR